MKKISIITINYNDKTGLKKTIESVKNQTFQDFEFVVVDGGSTDGSVEVLKEFPSIAKWISEKDNGVYHAMNKGIRLATGEYVIFMNSGDVFHNEKVLETVLESLSITDIVYGNTICYNDNGYYREEYPPNKLLFSFFCVAGINHQAVFIKRQLFYDHMFYNEDYKISADWEFFIYTICLKNVSYKHLDLFICNYDFSGFSSNPKNFDIYDSERDQTIQKYFPFLYDDYIYFKEIEFGSRRVKQFFALKKSKVAWRLIKWVMSFLSLFLPTTRKYSKI